MNPHAVTGLFETALCLYTGAPYAVAVNSCTMALTLACAWHIHEFRAGSPKAAIDAMRDWTPDIEIPKRTYVSVPMAIIHAGGRSTFRDEEWRGGYQLKPLPVWDFARWFTSGMYETRARSGGMLLKDFTGQMQCVSFHAAKTLGIEQGGAILHDNPIADEWLRMARFDGRAEGVPPEDQAAWPVLGWHCYMNPSTAAQGLLRLHSLPRHNAPLPNDPYPDLSEMEIFK